MTARKKSSQKEPQLWDNVSIRFPKGFHARLQEAADRLGITKSDIAKTAVISAVDAIEANGYRVTLPMRFALINDLPTPTSARSR